MSADFVAQSRYYGALKSSRSSHDSTHVLFSGLSVERVSSEGSPRVVSRLHCVFRWVPIDHEKVKGAVACVQAFVRHPLFTQRKFFSETGISKLNTAVTAADAVRHGSEFDPWEAFGLEVGPVFADLKSRREKVVSRKRQ